MSDLDSSPELSQVEIKSALVLDTDHNAKLEFPDNDLEFQGSVDTYKLKGDRIRDFFQISGSKVSSASNTIHPLNMNIEYRNKYPKTNFLVLKTSKLKAELRTSDISVRRQMGGNNTSKLERKGNTEETSSSGWESFSKKDMLEYRNGYPGKKDQEDLNSNYLFYTNQIPSKPDGDYIDALHENWWGDYARLEMHHGYIQWLFPLREAGMNYCAQELQIHEAENIQADPKASARLLKSYMLMLDFYGLRLCNRTTGAVERADNWKERLQHLNSSMHNYLRITRILKCLGEFGYEHLKLPLVEKFIYEAFVENTIPRAKDSCLKYWVETLRVDTEREKLCVLAKKMMSS